VGDYDEALAKVVVDLGLAREKRKPRPKAERPDVGRPVIKLDASEKERIVDNVELLLIGSEPGRQRGLYQRAGQVVSVQRVKAIAAGDKPISVAAICERGDYALLEDISATVAFLKFDKRANDWVLCDAPMWIVKTLKDRKGGLRFPVLAGVVHAPTMRGDGSVLTEAGYDPATGLSYDPLGVEFPPVPDHPTRDDAMRALGELRAIVKDFPFVTGAHRAVALSGLLTSVCRRALATAPLHAYSAPIRGSGKSKLVDLASVIATGLEAPVVAAGATEEELEKRLVSLLLEGRQLITIDNCSRALGGDFLCQILTQATVKPRILGKSEAPTCSTGALVMATGNNFVAAGDLERRTIVCKLDPKCETPETRVFAFEPVAVAKERRPALVVAAPTVLRAYHVAGRPGRPDPLGSFEDWSNLVRGALMWLGEADPVDTMAEVRASDPETAALRQVMAAWREAFHGEGVTVAQVIKRAMEQQRASSYEGRPEFVNEDLHEALMTVAGTGGGINSRRLGHWIACYKDRVLDGQRFVQRGERNKVAVWALASI
jgi:putative DNA primase/helicase